MNKIMLFGLKWIINNGIINFKVNGCFLDYMVMLVAVGSAHPPVPSASWTNFFLNHLSPEPSASLEHLPLHHLPLGAAAQLTTCPLDPLPSWPSNPWTISPLNYLQHLQPTPWTIHLLDRSTPSTICPLNHIPPRLSAPLIIYPQTITLVIILRSLVSSLSAFVKSILL